MKLTVFFDGQFWVGVVEEFVQDKVKAGKFLFGAEPKDQEILEFVQNELDRLTDRLSQSVETGRPIQERRINPKRLARQAVREVGQKGISSYAQEALKLEYEKRKKEKQVYSRQQREEMKDRKREIKVQKAKAKHRGK
jgi:cell division septum initiation protein DivIVA